jgi:hypothetical protein
MAALVVTGDLRSMLNRLMLMRAPMCVGVHLRHDDGMGYALPEYGFGSMEHNAAGFLCIEELNHIAMDVQEQHGVMAKYKTSQEFKDFLEETCAREQGRDIFLSDTAMKKLGSPTVEIALLEFKYHRDSEGGTLLPESGQKVVTSVATAGSGEEGEWNVWFDLFRRKFDETTFGTVLESTGNTGRNNHRLHKGAVPIVYDQYASKTVWANLSERLYEQLDNKSEECGHARADADYIFHWGCISHYETRIPGTNKTAEGWGDHEHWNLLYTIAMARHALDYLKRGGTLVLKVRMFENAETLALVSVLACAFEKVYLYANARMQAEFVAFVGVGFKGECDDVRLVREVLARSTSYRLSDICDARIMQQPEFHATMRYAEDTREEMRRDHDRVTLVMLEIMYLISARVDFGDGYLAAKLAALAADVPVEIDAKWIPGVIRQVRALTGALQRDDRANDRAKLRNFVQDFDLEKYQ